MNHVEFEPFKFLKLIYNKGHQTIQPFYRTDSP